MPSSSPALAKVQLRSAGGRAGLVAGLLLSQMITSTAVGQAALTAASFTADFSAMVRLKDRAAKVKGKIAVLLPETTTSARYTSFDQPYLRKAFGAAGLTADRYIISNAQGSESTELTQAQSAISQGATVLVVDPISSGVGVSIETYAKQHGVPVIDYDRLTLGGNRDYYVSFDNVGVGKLIGQGMDQCLTKWNVANPQILVMRGAPTDNNATLFAEGYMSVLKPSFDSGKYVNVGEPAGTWDPATARTTFEQQYTAHPNINAVLVPNDDNANAVISYLKTLRVPPKRFPTTGQDATLTGLQNVLAGYECGTVYKAIYLEAQASAALAIYLASGVEPPAALVNGKTADSTTKLDVPSVLLTPLWVTEANMADTVVKDGFVDPKKLCAGSLASRCSAAGIAN
jgi:D-xylose transport system substrate-binding protein